MAVDKFSRWLRAICIILLARNGPVDRQKALVFLEQAAEVVRDTSGGDGDEGGYPMDERQWAFTISYNAGVECLGANILDEGKRWFECASILSNFIGSPGMAEKVNATYENLLSRYPRT